MERTLIYFILIFIDFFYLLDHLLRSQYIYHLCRKRKVEIPKRKQVKKSK